MTEPIALPPHWQAMAEVLTARGWRVEVWWNYMGVSLDTIREAMK